MLPIPGKRPREFWRAHAPHRRQHAAGRWTLVRSDRLLGLAANGYGEAEREPEIVGLKP